MNQTNGYAQDRADGFQEGTGESQERAGELARPATFGKDRCSLAEESCCDGPFAFGPTFITRRAGRASSPAPFARWAATRWTAAVVLTAAGVLAFAPAASAIPPNDLCTLATPLPPAGQPWYNFSIAPLDTTTALREFCSSGEPDESCGHASGNSNSVYFLYTPTCAGVIHVNTIGSNYDTVLSIFDGCAQENPFCDQPAELGCNDDAQSGVVQSRLTGIPVSGATDYIIKVADYNTTPGGGTLRLQVVFSGADARSGKISRNIYRSPYANNVSNGVIVDYIDHCTSFDTRGSGRVCTGDGATPCNSNSNCSAVGGTCDWVMVAMADGIVCSIIEHYDDCGSAGAYGPYGNGITVLHANGEASRYLHIKQWSPTQLGITPGMFVTKGQPIAIEGDVGRTAGGQQSTCVTDGPPRAGTCLEAIPAGAGNCFRHNHWNIIRYTTEEVLNPYICGITGSIYRSGQTYASADCTSSGSYPTDLSFSNSIIDGYINFIVHQARNSITASTVNIQSQASVVYHAGESVRLTPGFHVWPNGYFRAEIAAPNTTAASSWAAPLSCPCTGATGFCFQWSDPSNPDGVTQGCPTPGPASSDRCHGCSFGGRCCPCIANGTCLTDGTCAP